LKSLRGRLILVIGLTTLLPLVFTGWMTSTLARDHHVAQSKELYARQAHGLATYASTWMRDLVRTAGLAVAVWDVENLDSEHREALQQVLYTQFDAVNVVVMYDADGVEVTEPTFYDAVPADLSRHLPVDEARVERLRAELPLTEALDAGYAIGPIYRPDGRTSVIPVAVSSRAGGIVVGLEVSLAEVESHFLEQAVEGGAAVLVDRRGDALLGDPGDLVDAELTKTFQGNLSGDLRYESDGRPVLAAFDAVDGTAWAVVVAVPEAIATRAGDQIRQRSLFVYAIALVLVGAMGAVAAGQIARPVLALRGAASGLGGGAYTPVELDGDAVAELQDLATVFNETSELIAQKNAEIEAWNEELQERVEERTAELQESNARLVQSSRLAAVAQMGAGLAHELNNPLAGMLGLTQLLRAKNPDDPLLLSMEEQARRCSEVVATLNRLSGGATAASREEVDLHEVLADVVGLVRHGFLEAQVTLEHEREGALPVVGAPTVLAQSLGQLLGSLRAQLAPGGVLRVRGVVQEGEARLEFLLSGPRRESGDDWLASGMGFWVASHAVQEHGGRIEEGQGRYTLVLPAR